MSLYVEYFAQQMCRIMLQLRFYEKRTRNSDRLTAGDLEFTYCDISAPSRVVAGQRYLEFTWIGTKQTRQSAQPHVSK